MTAHVELAYVKATSLALAFVWQPGIQSELSEASKANHNIDLHFIHLERH